ncbi:MAG: acyltransferase [Edaphobacter sp.]|uniref:acyltransferase family protein n=1 Tax=Edaphobacter sp. TaxID=1934404 RepID=UPI00239AB7FF|nr:acyltransferase [Edaphobacter sp.]MDE1178851.1 acyltransferase [Edaphobacter sp.]
MPTVHQEKTSTWSSVHLDAVRGLAALAVMMFHDKSFFFSSLSDSTADVQAPVLNSSTATPAPPPVFHRRADMGNTPVMIFFVLSGYLVGGSVIKSLKRQTWSAKTYLIKRLTRLWVVLLPALLFGLLLDNIGYRLLGAPGQIYVAHIGFVYPHVAQDFRLTTILGNIFFLQGIFVSTPGSNGALWSLSNEFWYYILFPMLVVPFVLKRSAMVKIASVGFVVAFLAFVSARSDPASLKHIPILFPIWIMGALVALAPLRVPDRFRGVTTGMMLLLLVAGTLLLRKFDIGVHKSQYIIGILFSGLLYLLLHYKETSRPGWYRSVAGFFSKISYSLYVLHMPLGTFLAALLLRPWHMRTKTPLNVAEMVGFFSLIVLITFGFYSVFEANTDRIRNLLFDRRERSIAAVNSPELPARPKA